MSSIRDNIFTAFFLTDGNSPATGLSPTIDIYETATGDKVVDGEDMTEIGGGLYKYVFEDFDYEKDYNAVADGTATLTGSNRYVPMANETDVKSISAKLSADHGSGNWDRHAGGFLSLARGNNDASNLDIERLAERLVPKIIESMEEREIDIPYVFPTETVENALRGYLNDLYIAAEEQINRATADISYLDARVTSLHYILDEAISSSKELIISTVLENAVDLAPLMQAVNTQGEDTRLLIKERTQQSAILRKIENTANDTQAVVRRNIDGAYRGLMAKIDQPEELYESLHTAMKALKGARGPIRNPSQQQMNQQMQTATQPQVEGSQPQGEMTQQPPMSALMTETPQMNEEPMRQQSMI